MRVLNHRFWIVPVLALIAVTIFAFRPRDGARDRLSTLPPVMLWAWERPEDLSFIDTQQVGVAFLAKTINLRSDSATSRSRLQPLKLADGTKLVAVARVESDPNESPHLSSAQLEKTVAEIVALSKLSNVTAVQIDFDARLSERNFYRKLLQRVRDDLPPSMALSMTALASWCAGDDWLDQLPIDEAVPMFFRLGLDQRRFESRLQSGELFLKAPCKTTAGVSTDEPVALPAVNRLYVFSPTPWTQTALNHAMEVYKR